MKRAGEKPGWIGGWSGGFIWVFILSIIFLIREASLHGSTGLALVVVSEILIVVSAPWRYPDTPYWQLMIPVYLAFILAVAWALWSHNGPDAPGIGWQSVFILLPLLLPIAIAGRRRWNDA